MKKLIKYLIIATLLITTALFVIGYLNKTEGKSEQEDLSKTSEEVKLDNKSNGFYAIAGINAPEGEDVHEYGLKVIKNHEDFQNSIMKSKRNFAVLNQVSKNEVNIKGDFAIDCWIWIVHFPSDKCYNREELAKFIEDNQLILDRYTKSRDYDRYVSANLSSRSFSSNLQSSNKLFLANLSLINRGKKPDEALKRLLENIEFLLVLLKDTQNADDKSMVLSVYEMNLRLIPVIINSDTSLAKKYLDILQPKLAGDIDMNIEGYLQLSYNYFEYIRDSARIKKASEVESDEFLDELYNEYSKDIIDFSNTPHSEIEKREEALKEKYAYTENPKSEFFRRYVSFVGTNSYSNVTHAKYIDAYEALLSAYLAAKAGNIDENNMPSFLEENATQYYNLYDNKVFKWDTENSSIYYNRGPFYKEWIYFNNKEMLEYINQKAKVTK